jgi:hypothetical protein
MAVRGDEPLFSRVPGCEGGDLNPDALSGASTSIETEAGEVPPPTSSREVSTSASTALDGPRGAVCNAVGNAISELEAAIATLTRLLGTTDDAATAANLVTERKAMREELHELREAEARAGVVDLDVERHRRLGQRS